MKLSKNESKYRQKLFSERNYDKFEQLVIDETVENGVFYKTYKSLYYLHSINGQCGVFSGIALRRINQRLYNIGISTTVNRDTYRRFEDVLTDIASKWDTLSEDEQNKIAKSIVGK